MIWLKKEVVKRGQRKTPNGAGREAAKKRGPIWTAPKLALDHSELAQRLVWEGKSVREIAFGLFMSTQQRLSTRRYVAKDDIVQETDRQVSPSIN